MNDTMRNDPAFCGVVDLLAKTTDKEAVAELLAAACMGAADATAESCASILEGVIPVVEASFSVPEGQTAVAPLDAVFKMLRGLAGSMRELKSGKPAGSPT